MFYDSNNQGELYHNFDVNLVNKLRNYGGVDYYLDINCRNTRPIAIQTAVVSGFSMAEATIQYGEKVEYIWYKDLFDLKKRITNLLKKLINRNGIKPEDITLLYPGGFEDVKESLLGINLSIDIIELTAENINLRVENTLYICSIQAYKGLENKVIIIMGINQIEGNWIDTLNYIGMSRARELLCVAINERIRQDFELKVRKFLEKQRQN